MEFYNKLLDWFKPYKLVLVAFSGGVDSCFVLKAAIDSLGKVSVKAITGDSPSLARQELLEAKEFANSLGVEHIILPTKELENPDYQANLGNRCYFCKNTLYKTIAEDILKQLNVIAPETASENFSYALVDGANLDDLKDQRPGHAAAKEIGVKHPLVEIGFTKEMVRSHSKMLNLKTWDKPAMACLSSRVAVGTKVSLEKLSLIESSELILKELGFRGCRVRYHELQSNKEEKEKLARIELENNEENIALIKDQEKIVAKIKELGFSFVTLDLEGYKKGGRSAH